MKIVVTGGSGLIGQALTTDLAGRGHEVWVLSRNPKATGLEGKVQAVRWDGETPRGWEQLAAEADAIINLAGANIGARPWTNERKRLIRDSRVNAGRAVVAAIRQNERRPQVVLQIAGVGYYGVHGDEPLDEDNAPGNDYLARVAVDWEESTKPVADLVVRPMAGAVVRHVVLRTGVVLAPVGGVLAPFVLQNKLFAGGPLGSGRQWISWIHIRDLVRAMNFLLERADAGGVFNVTSPDPVTNADFGRAVSKAMHRPYWLPAPAFMLRLGLGEMSTLVLDGQRVLPKRLQEMGFQFEFGELRKALEDLLGNG
jgi:uncharacterized protein (TIGR01777 family)